MKKNENKHDRVELRFRVLSREEFWRNETEEELALFVLRTIIFGKHICSLRSDFELIRLVFGLKFSELASSDVDSAVNVQKVTSVIG